MNSTVTGEEALQEMAKLASWSLWPRVGFIAVVILIIVLLLISRRKRK